MEKKVLYSMSENVIKSLFTVVEWCLIVNLSNNALWHQASFGASYSAKEVVHSFKTQQHKSLTEEFIHSCIQKILEESHI